MNIAPARIFLKPFIVRGVALSYLPAIFPTNRA